MTDSLTTQVVWDTLNKELFAVVGMVTAKGEARTAGVVYAVHDGNLYFSTKRSAWKTRHISQNPHISMTVTVPKRIPFLPWIKIPAATITFSGHARVLDVDDVADEILEAVYQGQQKDSEIRRTTCVIEVTPMRDFVTYGVGVSLSEMRDTEKARGRVPVAS